MEKDKKLKQETGAPSEHTRYDQYCVEMINGDDERGLFGEFQDPSEAASFAKHFIKPHFPDAEYMIYPLTTVFRLSDDGKYYVMDSDFFAPDEENPDD